MNTYFISDLHFNHENMAWRRGFTSADEMNRHIIECWNKVVVNSGDIVYILGDITMAKLSGYDLLDQLNGVKHVVLGNHDKKNHSKHLLYHVETVSGVIYYKGQAILSHCPIHPCELQYGIGVNIHGHLHQNSLDDKRYINVCAEMVDYKPRTLEELLIPEISQ